MKVIGQFIFMALLPFAVLLLAVIGAPLWLVILLVVVPAFIWTLGAVDDYPGSGHR